jgi:hypothetical protein
MNRIRAVASLVSLFLLATALGLAAEPATLAKERLSSANGGFYVELCSRPTGTCSADVYLAGGDVKLWSTWVEWRAGYTARLSDDGMFLAVVNDVYGDSANLVTVYSESGMKAYSTKSIVIPRVHLKFRNSRLVWITDLEGGVKFAYDGSKGAVGLVLSLVDGRSITIALR